MRFRRFEVEGESMRPTLSPGDYVLGSRAEAMAPGDLVAFEHPGRPGFWLIKRVIAIGGSIDLDAGTVDGLRYEDPHREPLVESGRFDVREDSMFVLSDNRTSTRADSRSFGPVPTRGAYHIRFRYWRRPGRL